MGGLLETQLYMGNLTVTAGIYALIVSFVLCL